MVLYEADISKLATPVKSVKSHKKTKPESAPQVATPDPVPETKKRKLSAKQVAALEKGQAKLAEYQESKKVKIEETKPEAEPVKKQRKRKSSEESVEEVKPEDQPESKPKRARKKKEETAVPIPEPTPEPVPEPIPEPEPVKEVKQRKPRQKRDPAEPPVWFHKYVEGVKKEQALQKEEKIPAKQVKVEAEQAAKKSWDNGFIRDRVTNEVDNHMSRMYSMIFSGR